MVTTAKQTTSLIAITLPSIPHSAEIARSCIRGALTYHDLSGYVQDAEAITSELVTNAIEHAAAPYLGLELMTLTGSEAVAVVVTDPSPRPPVKRYPPGDSEHGRGLTIVDALSARWGWRPQNPGKAVYAILTMEA